MCQHIDAKQDTEPTRWRHAMLAVALLGATSALGACEQDGGSPQRAEDAEHGAEDAQQGTKDAQQGAEQGAEDAQQGTERDEDAPEPVSREGLEVATKKLDDTQGPAKWCGLEAGALGKLEQDRRSRSQGGSIGAFAGRRKRPFEAAPMMASTYHWGEAP